MVDTQKILNLLEVRHKDFFNRRNGKPHHYISYQKKKLEDGTIEFRLVVSPDLLQTIRDDFYNSLPNNWNK